MDFTFNGIEFGHVDYISRENQKIQYRIVFSKARDCIPSAKEIIKDPEEGAALYSCFTIDHQDNELANVVLSISSPAAKAIMKREYRTREGIKNALEALKKEYISLKKKQV